MNSIKSDRNKVENLEYVEPEIWKDIEGYEGDYKVSSLGRIKSIKRDNPIILKQDVSNGGYCRVTLFKKGHRERLLVHRIVGIAFVENPENKPEINHLDGDTSNNWADNIEWCTHSENMKHAFSNGFKKPILGEMNPNTSLTKKDVYRIRKLVEENNKSTKEIADIFKVSKSTISRIHRRERWGHI